METKSKKPFRIGRRRVFFSLKAPDAKAVSVVGDFNGWRPDEHPMKRHETGEWKKHLFLSPGRYEYKFIVDGQWWEDPASEQRCPNQHGTYNSVVVVEAK
jgi:1,4-alpha-glucan branching enzyme